MKRLIAAAIRCSLMFLVPSVTYAISTQWDLDPISGDWNTSANWTPNAVPNGRADSATFGLSNTTDVSISANTEVNGITFTPAASAYTITASPSTLTISGAGVTNNSGITQNFAIAASGNSGTIVFSNNATAGTNVAYLSSFSDLAGEMIFKNNSTAGSATIGIDVDTGGLGRVSLTFANNSTAANSDITTRRSPVQFLNNATAGNSSIFNDGGRVLFANNSTAGSAAIGLDFFSDLTFANNSTAANSTIGTILEEAVRFLDNATAGSALIGLSEESNLFFADRSRAGNASIQADGGHILFGDSSRGGTARIDLFSLGPGIGSSPSLDISGHNAPGVTIGSLETGGRDFSENDRVFLGANNLTVGSNNLSTTFAGVIQDGGQGGGVGGSLTKIGTGTFILTGANTYTGNTNVKRGVLQVDGSIASNTFVNGRGTLAGTGTISGNVTNNGRVSPGSAASPGMLTVTGNYTQAQYATLMIQIAGTNTGQFSVLNVLGNANLNGLLNPVLLNGFVPTIGQTFTFLDYARLTGSFSRMQNQLFNNRTEQWNVVYQPNEAILTVGPNTIPDQGSTLLLLMLGLLGLVTYRRQLLRRQS